MMMDDDFLARAVFETRNPRHTRLVSPRLASAILVCRPSFLAYTTMIPTVESFRLRQLAHRLSRQKTENDSQRPL